jgi:hypothetical protein
MPQGKAGRMPAGDQIATLITDPWMPVLATFFFERG